MQCEVEVEEERVPEGAGEVTVGAAMLEVALPNGEASPTQVGVGLHHCADVALHLKVKKPAAVLRAARRVSHAEERIWLQTNARWTPFFGSLLSVFVAVPDFLCAAGLPRAQQGEGRGRQLGRGDSGEARADGERGSAIGFSFHSRQRLLFDPAGCFAVAFAAAVLGVPRLARAEGARDLGVVGICADNALRHDASPPEHVLGFVF